MVNRLVTFSMQNKQINTLQLKLLHILDAKVQNCFHWLTLEYNNSEFKLGKKRGLLEKIYYCGGPFVRQKTTCLSYQLYEMIICPRNMHKKNIKEQIPICLI